MSDLAVITDPDWGWLSIRIRWKRHIPTYFGDVAWYDLEDFSGAEARTPGLRRLKWLRTALEGRRAAKRAYADGHRTMLVATLQYAPLFPLWKDARYLIYGDVTPRQYDALYCGESDDRPRKRYLRARYRRLASMRPTMLCMSPWFRQDLIAGYGVLPEDAVVLRPLIDTFEWKPKAARESESVVNVIFIGGDFDRKGGNLLLDLSADPRFSHVRWRFMTNHPDPGLPRCSFHPGIVADTPEHRGLIETSDLLALPTSADCYSHAAIEASAAGLPSVITDVGGIADIVETGVNGVLLEHPTRDAVACALERYVGDPGRIAREGAAARRLVEERNSVETHMAVLRERVAG